MKFTYAMSLLILLIFSACTSVNSNREISSAKKKFAIIAGGGCERKDNTRTASSSSCAIEPKCDSDGYYNLFKGEIDTAYKSLTANGWSTEVLYGDSRWEKNPQWKAKDFNSDNLIAALDDKANNFYNKLENGDQLIIAIASHGMPGPDHTICYTDDYGFDHNISVESLKPTIQTLTSRGVKVAWIENTCYSGSSVENLNDTNACVITSSNPNTEGVGDDIWRNLFGLGIEGGKVSSYYAKETVRGKADISDDRKISASEAFHFGNLHMIESQIPRISECENNLEELGLNLNEYSEFLKQPLLQNLSDVSSFKFVSDIYQFKDQIDFNTRMKVQADLVKFKYGDEINFEQLHSKLGMYLRVLKSMQTTPYIVNSPTYYQQMQNQKNKVITAIKGLYYYACKVKLKQKPRNECENFILFDKQSSPSN